ncbi:MAG: serine hydrolase [Cyclobacteriaceae bacterium]|nr:serine hydrolase [Cyclobacteriaceae bacterium]
MKTTTGFNFIRTQPGPDSVSLKKHFILCLAFFGLLFLVNACQKPAAPEEELLSISTPEAQGVSSASILDFINAAEQEQPDALHSLMIVRHGKTIAQGWWAPYNPDSPHLLYSLSKSFASTAIGLAVEEKLLSTDDLVISFFPEKVIDTTDNNLKAMRIHDLLRMNTGHLEDATGRTRSAGDDWVANFLSLPVERKPGTVFVYNSAATYILSAILQKLTGQTVVEYLQPRLFDPLEIKPPTWESDPKGINVGGWGLSVTTEDIAKFGQLYLQKGNWKGKQIIPEAWVEKATSYLTSNGSNPESDWEQGYGYQFWQCRHNAYRGDGAFGQYCIVIPEQDAVIAITSGSRDMPGILNLVWAHLLPAMNEAPMAEDTASQRLLAEKLASLKIAVVEGENTSAVSEEINGKSFEFAKNPLALEKVSFSKSGADMTITLTNASGDQVIPVGFGKTENSQFSMPGRATMQIASSGAWISPDSYKVTMINYESPHARTLTFTFKGKEMECQVEENVSFGSTKMAPIKATLMKELSPVL